MKKNRQRYQLEDYQLPELDSILWDAFSLYTRLRFSDGRGAVSCVTCDKEFYFRKIQAGHYRTRSCKYVKFSEFNVHPQCAGCNKYLKGNPIKYRKFLLKTYGEYVIDYIEDAPDMYKRDRFTYLELIRLYFAELINLDNYNLDESKFEKKHSKFLRLLKESE